MSGSKGGRERCTWFVGIGDSVRVGLIIVGDAERPAAVSVDVLWVKGGVMLSLETAGDEPSVGDVSTKIVQGSLTSAISPAISRTDFSISRSKSR